MPTSSIYCFHCSIPVAIPIIINVELFDAVFTLSSVSVIVLVDEVPELVITPFVDEVVPVNEKLKMSENETVIHP
jgi:hypothetical protein